MTTFTKAKPAQAKLRLSMYGPPGSGKTFTSLLIAEGIAAKEKKRIAFVDTEESGTDFYSREVPDRAVHPKAFDFDLVKTQSLADTIEACESLDPKKHGVIVIDSITHLWEAAIAAWEAHPDNQKTSADTIPMHAWGKIKRPYKGFIKWLMESEFHVIICGRQKNIFGPGKKEGEDMAMVGVGMNAEKDTAYETQINARLECKIDQESTTRSKFFCYFEKDRTGLLSGRTFANVGYENFEPVMRLLGGEQVKMGTAADIAEKDAGLLDKQAKEALDKKSEKSLAAVQKYMAAIEKVKKSKEAADWKKIADGLKKDKAKFLPEHLEMVQGAWDAAVKAAREA